MTSVVVTIWDSAKCLLQGSSCHAQSTDEQSQYLEALQALHTCLTDACQNEPDTLEGLSVYLQQSTDSSFQVCFMHPNWSELPKECLQHTSCTLQSVCSGNVYTLTSRDEAWSTCGGGMGLCNSAATSHNKLVTYSVMVPQRATMADE